MEVQHLMAEAILKVSKDFSFEASHILPRHRGRCSNLHGHSFTFTVTVEGPVNEWTGFVVDYGDLKALVDREIIQKVDHQHLGMGSLTTPFQGDYTCQHTYPCVFEEAFYPSSEMLVLKFAEILEPLVPELVGSKRLKLAEIRLRETCTSEAIWYPR
jgi:6-pyruvoyltetrahydropterin/6-carboxytetrahydropterin synthase